MEYLGHFVVSLAALMVAQILVTSLLVQPATVLVLTTAMILVGFRLYHNKSTTNTYLG